MCIRMIKNISISDEKSPHFTFSFFFCSSKKIQIVFFRPTIKNKKKSLKLFLWHTFEMYKVWPNLIFDVKSNKKRLLYWLFQHCILFRLPIHLPHTDSSAILHSWTKLFIYAKPIHNCYATDVNHEFKFQWRGRERALARMREKWSSHSDGVRPNFECSLSPWSLGQ